MGRPRPQMQFTIELRADINPEDAVKMRSVLRATARQLIAAATILHVATEEYPRPEAAAFSDRYFDGAADLHIVEDL